MAIVAVAAGGYFVWTVVQKPPVLVKFTGRVMYEGQPVAVGGIATAPFDGNLDGAVSSFDEEGRFSLMTNGELGAYTGRHKVVISSNTPTMPPQSLIPAAYGSMATTPLTINVSDDSKKNDVEFLLEGTLPAAASPPPANPESPGRPAAEGEQALGDPEKNESDSAATQQQSGENKTKE